eukprot:1160026-Pelagomonas_calceolata.AAC.8
MAQLDVLATISQVLEPVICAMQGGSAHAGLQSVRGYNQSGPGTCDGAQTGTGRELQCPGAFCDPGDCSQRPSLKEGTPKKERKD